MLAHIPLSNYILRWKGRLPAHNMMLIDHLVPPGVVTIVIEEGTQAMDDYTEDIFDADIRACASWSTEAKA